MKQFFAIVFFFICFQGLSQQPIFVSADTALYSINLINCTSRFIFSRVSWNDIAFTSDGRLWGISTGLCSIDTTNGSYTYIGESAGTYGVSLAGLNDSTLIGQNNDSLYAINVSNGQSYNLGYLGYDACGDLSWLDNALYMNACNQLIKIILNDTYTKVVNVTAVNSIDNPIPEFDGLATASFSGSDSLVGFGGPYILNQANGTYKQICGPQLPIGGLGAASMSFPSVLPVHLLNFYCTITNKTIRLQWQTESEINSDYFLIEKSSDGVNFSAIGKQAASDNSSSLKQYSFIDNNPASVNYYRLKEVDLNGNYIYSKILLVKQPRTQSLIIISNPVRNNLQLQINNATTQTNYLSILDFTGRRLKIYTMQNGLQNIDVSYLASGTYVLQMITSDGQMFSNHFIKAL